MNNWFPFNRDPCHERLKCLGENTEKYTIFSITIKNNIDLV